MLEFYPQIKHVHIAAALLSGSLFAVRGGFLLADARWPASGPVRWTSYVIDTTLLTAALMLLTILPHGVFANGWLAVKLTLLAAYIVLGVLAMGRARRPRTQALCYAAALMALFAVYSTARAHSPLGVYTWWFG